MVRFGKSIAKQSGGRAGENVASGGRVKKLCGVEDHSVPIPEETTRELGGIPVASFDARGEGHEVAQETIPARPCGGLSAELLGLR